MREVDKRKKAHMSIITKNTNSTCVNTSILRKKIWDYENTNSLPSLSISLDSLDMLKG